MSVEFKCQGCGAVLVVDAPPGTQVACPECRATQKVPSDAVAGGAGGAGALVLVRGIDWYDVVSRGLPWAMSAAMHAALLLIMAFIAWSTLVQDTPRQEILIPSATLGEPGGSLQPGPENEQLDPPQNEVEELDIMPPQADPLQSPLLVVSRSATADSLAMALSGAGRSTGGTVGSLLPLEGGGHPGPRSMFMGTGGYARRVCYIIDRSGSMAVAFDYVRRELFRSIQDLQQEQLFHTIFFNAGEPIEAPPRQLVSATDRHKIEAIDFIATIVATGRTDPRPAFRRAFQLNPRPDLIYFLTDGAFDPDLLDDLRRMNPDGRTQINTIAFLSRPSEDLLKQIAQQNRGTYTFVNPGAETGDAP